MVVRLDAAGNIIHSSLLGGVAVNNSIDALSRAPNGSLYAAGRTYSPLFPGGPTLSPTSAGAFAFAFRFDWEQIRTGLPAPSCMAQSATIGPVPAAPLSIATLFGSNLGPVAGVQYRLDADGRVPTELGGTRVTVGDIPAPILYAQDQQINFIVPGGLTGSTTQVCVEAAGP
ncbi:MAG: hypothetical protein JWO19_3939 [Bryobacterales bacterium]|nr:hypothetical protein [Bryobacterales bacterium]